MTEHPDVLRAVLFWGKIPVFAFSRFRFTSLTADIIADPLFLFLVTMEGVVRVGVGVGGHICFGAVPPAYGRIPSSDQVNKLWPSCTQLCFPRQNMDLHTIVSELSCSRRGCVHAGTFKTSKTAVLIPCMDLGAHGKPFFNNIYTPPVWGSSHRERRAVVPAHLDLKSPNTH